MSEEGQRNNFTIVPNIIYEMGLSPFAIALYAAARRSAGDDGVCTRSAATLARNSGMSKSMVHYAKMELVEAKLIQLREAPSGRRIPAQHILMVDIWHKNAEHFAPKEPVQETQPQDTSCPNRPESDLIEQDSALLEQGAVHSKNRSKTTSVKSKSKNIPYGGKSPQTASRKTSGNGKAKKKAEPTVISPAVALYRHHCKLFPAGIWQDRVTFAVGDNPADLQFWEEVIVAWLGRGNKRGNVAAMLEWYDNREIPPMNPYAKRQGPQQQGNVITVKQ